MAQAISRVRVVRGEIFVCLHNALIRFVARRGFSILLIRSFASAVSVVSQRLCCTNCGNCLLRIALTASRCAGNLVNAVVGASAFSVVIDCHLD